MRVYKEKQCVLCSKGYIPTSPKQKFCIICKDVAAKTAQKEHDKKRNRKKYLKIYTRTCPVCEEVFTTHYGSKTYCGAKECEIIRKRINRVKVDKRRSILRSKKAKLEKYRQQGQKLKEIKRAVALENYKLISAKKYKNTHYSELVLLCPEGHLYTTTFHNFSDNNNRCVTCYSQNNYVSKPEQLVRTFIEEEFTNLPVIYNDRSVVRPKELDFYFPDNNLAIEVCGLYWHGELVAGKPRDYHYNKMQQCFAKGVRLITVFEDELLNQKEVVFSRIRQALGRPTRRVFARKCIVCEISSKEANSFYRTNHIQGASTAMIRYGLFYQDELLCVGSLGKFVRKHTATSTTLELKRFCTLPGVSVVGGVGKIFKRMTLYAADHGYTHIKSYCDMRYANIFNPVYEVIGFTLDSFTKYTPHYFKSGKRYRNFSLRKTPEERLTNKTEWQLRQDQGYDRIWDCGHRTYLYTL